MNVPFPLRQGPREHFRVTVVVELVFPLFVIVLTTVTVHLMPVVAPLALGPTPLHWRTLRSAA